MIWAVFGPPNCGNGSGFFFRPTCGAGSADDRGIHAPEVTTELAVLVEVVEQAGEDPHPGTVDPPASEAVINRLPRAVAWRDVAPGGTGVQAPEDTVEEPSMGLPRVSPSALVAQVREQVLETFPLAILKFIAPWHGGPPFGNLPAGQLEFAAVMQL
jgi:hypothetical protein